MNMFEQMPFSEKYQVFRKLAEIGDLRKLSREELELYDEDIKNMRDIYATRKFDEKRGMAKGMEKEKLATARRLLSMGLSEAQVATATELPLEEIQKMKEQEEITRRLSFPGAAIFVCLYVMQIVLSLLHVFKIFMIIFFNRLWDGFLHLLVQFAFFVFYER